MQHGKKLNGMREKRELDRMERIRAYEREKQKLQSKNLTQREYEQAIREITKELNI